MLSHFAKRDKEEKAGRRRGAPWARVIPVLLVLLLLLPETVLAGWYNADWLYRKKITIDDAKVGATGAPHTNFPVLISLTADADLSAEARSDGYDILFTSSNGTTKLNHQRVSYSSGTLEAWVNIASLPSSGDTDIYMYYGYASASDQQSATATWNSNFKAVLHLEEASGTFYDATSNANNGTDLVSATGKAGQVGSGQNFDGTDDRINGTYILDPNTGNWTIEFWTKLWKLPSVKGATEVLVSQNDGTGTGRSLIYAGSSDNKIASYIGGAAHKSGKVMVYNTWTHVALIKTAATSYSWYIDGAWDSNFTDTGDSATGIWKFAASKTNAQELEGNMDEIRVSNTDRSAGWFLTGYNNQKTPGTFYTLGSEEDNEKTWDGGASTDDWEDANNWNPNGVPSAEENVSLTGAVTINIYSAAVCNDITLNNSSLNLYIRDGYSLTVSGDLTVTSGVLRTLEAFPTVSGTVALNGGSVVYQATSGSQTIVVQDYWNLNTNSAATKTLAGSVTVVGNLSVNGGTLDLGAYTANRTSAGGTLTLASGTTLKIGGTGTIPSNYSTHSINSTSTVEYDGTTQTVAQLNSSQNYGNLTISGSGTKTLAATTVVSGNLTISAGTLSTGGSSRALTVGGNWSNAGTFTANSGTVTFNAASGTQTLNPGSSSFYRLTHSTAGTLQLVTNGLTVTNTFTQSGGIFNANGRTAAFSTLVTLSSGTYQASTATQTFNGGLTVSGATFTGGSGTVDVNGNFILSSGSFTAPTGNLAVRNAWTHTAGGTFSHNNGTVTFDGNATLTANVATTETFKNLTINKAGYTTTISSGDTLKALGTLTLTDGIVNTGTLEGVANVTVGSAFDGGTAILKFTGAATQNFDLTGATGNFNGDIFVNKSGGQVNLASALTMNSASQDLTIQEGTIDISGQTLTVNGAGSTFIVENGGNLRMQGGETLTAPTLNAGSMVTYDGTSASYTMKNYAYKDLTITGGASTQFSLPADITVSETLTFTSGLIATGANSLYVSSTGSVSRTSGHVVGNFKKYIATGGTSKTFEIGDASDYTPVDVSFGNVSVAGDLTATTTGGDHGQIGSSYINSTKTANRYWTLTNSGISFNTYDVTFTFVAGDLDGGADTASFMVGRYSGGWTYPTVGTKTATSTEATGLTTFSDFQLGGADTVTWDGGAGTNNWEDANNWHPNGVPSSAESVSLTGAYTIDIYSAAVCNDLSIGTGGINLYIRGSYSLAISGNLTMTSGNLRTLEEFPTVSGSVTLSGGTVVYQATSGSQTIVVQNYRNLYVASAATKVPAGSITISGNLTLASGTLDLGAYTANRTSAGGTLTLANSSVLKIGGTGTIPANYSTHSLTSTSTVEYAGTTQTVAELNSSQDYGHLTISGSGTKTLAAATEVRGNLTISAGTLSTGSNYGLTVGGNWSNAGTFTANSGTVTFNATSGTQTLNPGSSSFYRLTHSTAGTLQLVTNGLTVTNTFTQSGGIFDANGQTAAFTTLVTLASGTYQASTATQTFNGGLTVSGATFTGGSGDVDVNGSFLLSGGSFTAPAGTMYVKNNFTQENSPTFTHNSGTITFDDKAHKTIDAPDFTFNLVDFNMATTASANYIITIEAGTTIPLGNDPSTNINNTYNSYAYSFINNGTITVGTGTWSGVIEVFTNNGTVSGSVSDVTVFQDATNNDTITLSSADTFDFAGSYYNISGSSLTTAATPEWNIAGDLTVESGSTFPSNSTVTFDGYATRTIDAPGVTFALVDFAISTGASGNKTVTIVAGTTIPLGDDPSTTINSTTNSYKFTLVNNGTITVGTGTWTGTLEVLENNNVVSGSVTSVTGVKNITNNDEISLPSCSNFVIAGGFLDGDYINAAGSSLTTAASPTWTIRGDLIVDAGSTFPSNSTVTFNLSGHKNIDAPGVTFALVDFDMNFTTSANYTITVYSGTTIPLGDNPTTYINNAYVSYKFYLVNNGTITVGTGTWTGLLEVLTNNGMIRTKGASAGFTGSYTNESGSTVEFIGDGDAGADSYTITDFSTSYHHLTIDSTDGSTDTYELGSSIVVPGNFSLSAGTFADGGYTLSVNGDAANSGTHTGAGKILLTGGAGAHALSGTGSYTNLELNDAQDATMSGDVTVNGTLTFTSGIFTTGANSVIISSTGSVSRTSGHVVGNFKKYIATGATAETFEIGDASNYTPVSVSFGNVSVAGNLTAKTTAGDHGQIGTSTVNAAQSANRNWTLTNSSITFDSCGVTFTFVAGDLDGGADTDSFIVGRYSGSWTYPTVGTKTATTTETTGLTAFGDFQLGETGTPIITMTKVTAVISDPYNGGTNPKRIPGAVIEISITPENAGTGSADADTVYVIDPIDNGKLAFYVTDGVTFTDGETSSGLALGAVTYSSTAAPGPYIFTYTPVPDGDGYDDTITAWKITTTGTFAFEGSPSPSFTLTFRGKLN